MNRSFLSFAAIGLALAALVVFLKWSPSGASLLWEASGGGAALLPLLVAAALIDSINPCAISVLLLTIAFLFSIGRLRASILGIGAAYIAGLFVVYLLIGLGILQALHLFGVPHFMARLGALLLIALGAINLAGEIFPGFPVRFRIPRAAHGGIAVLMEKASLPTAFLLGGLVGLCEFPCTGGPYLMVLGLLHDQVTYWRGLGYLIIYNLIFVLPLAVLLALAANRALLERLQEWKRRRLPLARWGGGIAMVVLGILIFLW